MEAAIILLIIFAIVLYAGKTTITIGRRKPTPDLSNEGLMRIRANADELFADYLADGGSNEDGAAEIMAWIEQSPKWGPRMRAGKEAMESGLDPLTAKLADAGLYDR